jgi:hypothetical protein
MTPLLITSPPRAAALTGSTDLLASGDAHTIDVTPRRLLVLPVEWAVRLMDRDNSYIDLADFYVEFWLVPLAWPRTNPFAYGIRGPPVVVHLPPLRSQHSLLNSNLAISRGMTLSFASGHIDLQSRPSRLLPETRQVLVHGHHRIGRDPGGGCRDRSRSLTGR